MQSLPCELETVIASFLNLKSLLHLTRVNKYYNSSLDVYTKVFAANVIKTFFKNLKLPTCNPMTMDDEIEQKLTTNDWVKLYYFFYDKALLEAELELVVYKIGSFYGLHRTLAMQRIVDDCEGLSTRYKLVNCLKNMTKDEIETIGW